MQKYVLDKHFVFQFSLDEALSTDAELLAMVTTAIVGVNHVVWEECLSLGSSTVLKKTEGERKNNEFTIESTATLVFSDDETLNSRFTDFTTLKILVDGKDDIDSTATLIFGDDETCYSCFADFTALGKDAFDEHQLGEDAKDDIKEVDIQHPSTKQEDTETIMSFHDATPYCRVDEHQLGEDVKDDMKEVDIQHPSAKEDTETIMSFQDATPYYRVCSSSHNPAVPPEPPPDYDKKLVASSIKDDHVL